jgi:hypothetical protein
MACQLLHRASRDHSSWLNQLERFFSVITDKAIRRGSFASVKELVAKINHFVAHYNPEAAGPSGGVHPLTRSSPAEDRYRVYLRA